MWEGPFECAGQPGRGGGDASRDAGGAAAGAGRGAPAHAHLDERAGLRAEQGGPACRHFRRCLRERSTREQWSQVLTGDSRYPTRRRGASSVSAHHARLRSNPIRLRSRDGPRARRRPRTQQRLRRDLTHAHRSKWTRRRKGPAAWGSAPRHGAARKWCRTASRTGRFWHTPTSSCRRRSLRPSAKHAWAS